MDAPVGDDGNTPDPSARFGAEDLELVRVEHREVVGQLLAELPEPEATIVALRFWGGLSQSQIAAHVGISQMHVSRLLANAPRAARTTAFGRSGVATGTRWGCPTVWTRGKETPFGCGSRLAEPTGTPAGGRGRLRHARPLVGEPFALLPQLAGSIALGALDANFAAVLGDLRD